jgi:NAD(P)-dependent dehydrogenase (short-subunit alcohol dehydrogenase family)
MILVTGATGHVGRAVVCRLASLGHDVVEWSGRKQAPAIWNRPACCGLRGCLCSVEGTRGH